MNNSRKGGNGIDISNPALRAKDRSDKMDVPQFFDNQVAQEWLSTEKAAQYLSISQNALRIMVYRDQIKAYKMGRRLRFRLRDCQSLFHRKGD